VLGGRKGWHWVRAWSRRFDKWHEQPWQLQMAARLLFRLKREDFLPPGSEQTRAVLAFWISISWRL
jgi:hypothetical protein